jgi:thermosome
MMTNQQPVFVLKEGTTRETGKDARKANINAAIAISEAVKSTLGPKGMDKIMVDTTGDVVISNDGATLLDEMELEHPAAKMIIEVAKSQDQECGDGTTTAVILTGELLKSTQKLLDKTIHPTNISQGFKLAADKAKEILEKHAVSLGKKDESILQHLAMTAIASKGASGSKELLSLIGVEAVNQVTEIKNGKTTVDLDNIQIQKLPGSAIEDTEIVKGVILDKERVVDAMPHMVNNARICLVDTALEVKKTEVDSKIQIQDPSSIQMFLDQEKSMMHRMVQRIKQSGANVLLCKKGIDDIAQHYLSEEGIYAVRRVKKSHMEKLAKATGASIVGNLEDLSEEDLGIAGIVEERHYGDDKKTFIMDCKNPKAISILLRGGTKHIVDELERAMHDALSVVKLAVEEGNIIVGGGAAATSVAMSLREYAPTVGGRQQMAIEAFADAMESIPKTLASNAGLDPIDVLVAIREKQSNGEFFTGVNVLTGEVDDMLEQQVVEPLPVALQEIETASEAAVMILRIDDVIIAKTDEKEKTPSSYGGAGR